MSRRFSGARLRAQREYAGVRLEQLALTIDRSASSVGQYERGHVVPSVVTLAAIADALDCPVDAFFDRDAA
jgi:transcriptional regulator with XRE-family HTH domain